MSECSLSSFVSSNTDGPTKASNEQIYISDTHISICSLVHL